MVQSWGVNQRSKFNSVVMMIIGYSMVRLMYGCRGDMGFIPKSLVILHEGAAQGQYALTSEGKSCTTEAVVH